MDEFEKLVAMIVGQAEDALEECGKRADLTNPRDAEHIKDLLKIMHYTDNLMDGGGYSGDGYGVSQNGEMNANGYYANRRGYSRTHYSMRRDSRGRYSGMSMEEHLAAMEREATTPEEREKVKRMRQMMR